MEDVAWPDALILYDGVCALCSRSVRAIVARDPAGRFRFVPIQSPYGSALAAMAGIDPVAPDSMAVSLDGRVLTKSDAAIAIASALRGLGWTRWFRAIPGPARDWIYDRVARNRYAIFGRSDECRLPAPAERRRFLDGRTAPPKAVE